MVAIITACTVSMQNSPATGSEASSNYHNASPTKIEFPVSEQDDASLISLECFTPPRQFEGLESVKKGYMDVTGQLVIPICFDTAFPFSDGLALVGISEFSSDSAHFGFYGVITPEETFSIPPVIDGTQRAGKRAFSEGLLPLKKEKDGKIGYIDKRGEFVIEPQFVQAASFHEGLAAVCVAEAACGYIDRAGSIVVEPRFKSASDFFEGVALVSIPGPGNFEETANLEIIDYLYGLIDRQGNFLLEPEVHAVGGVSMDNQTSNGLRLTAFSPEGLLPVRVSTTDTNFPIQGIDARDPIDGEGGILGHGKWGYARKTGDYAIKPQFFDATLFINGRAMVQLPTVDSDYPAELKGQYVEIDTEGNITYVYGDPTDNLDLIILIRECSSSYSVCGVEGRRLAALVPNIKLLSPFFNGLAVAHIENKSNTRMPEKLGYINAQGTFVIEPQFDEAMPFNEAGVAVVQLYEYENNSRKVRWGLIDCAGQYLIGPQERKIKILSNGLIALQDNSEQDRNTYFLTPGSLSVLPYRFAGSLDDSEGADPTGLIRVTGPVPEDFHL
ncbi:MAG: WG repeat-containing protein [Leptolyngbya sp. SIOISBB]|nr:WG repeat-containing protein [Leptolyngbya sp. SIOISBB]